MKIVLRPLRVNLIPLGIIIPFLTILIGLFHADLLSTSSVQGSRQVDLINNVTGELLYVVNANSSSISMIHPDTKTVVMSIPVGNSPHDIKLSDDQQLIYTTDIDSGTVSIVNASSNRLLNQITTGGAAVHGIAVFNDTQYVGDVYGGKILVIKDNAIKQEIKVGSGQEYVEARPPDGKVLYVANLWSPISVVDLAENRVIKSIDSGVTPHGLSFTKNGSRLFIVNMYSNTLSVIDGQKHEIITTIPVGMKPEYVKLSPDESYAYVTNLGEDTVSKIDLRTLEVTNKIPVGKGPHGIAFSADGDLAYISNMKANTVSVINTSTDKVVTDISTGGIEPHQIVVKKPFVSIISSSGPNTTRAVVYVEVADDAKERETGLMFRKNLEWNNRMLFIFDDEYNLSFWMKNTYIPLDMIFIDKDLRIVDIKENVQPCIEDEQYICPSYPSKQPAKYVLEVNAGFVEQNGIKAGDIIDL